MCLFAWRENVKNAGEALSSWGGNNVVWVFFQLFKKIWNLESKYILDLNLRWELICIVKLRPLQINYCEGQDGWLLDTEIEMVTLKQFANSRNQKSIYIII